MDVFSVAERLIYDMKKFSYYWDYHNKFDASSYLAFEEYLLCDNNLEKYLMNPDEVYQKYREYHNDDDIEHHESFIEFCKSFHVFPYDEEKLKDYKRCDNCKYYAHYTSLIDSDEFDDCSIEDTPGVAKYCDYHTFDVNKVRPLIRKLSK